MLMLTLLATLLILGQAPAPTPEMPSKELEAALETIKRADTFVVGPAGLYDFSKPRPVSSGEAALLTALKDDKAAARLAKLLKDASPAGRAYALLGLRHADQKAYDGAVKELKS